MAYRYGNNYRVLVVKESNAGTTPAVTWATAANRHLIPDIVEMSAEVAQIETNSKTGTGLATYCENRPGYQNATVTLTGVLSHEHEFLLKGLGYHYNTGVYTLDALPTTFPTYSIIRLWSDTPTGNPANDYVADIAVGCQLSSLKITGGSGDMVRYEATFQSMGITAETTISIPSGAGTNDPGTPCLKGFNFGNVTANLSYGSGDYLKSFDLTLGYEIADEATSYQNSNTRLETIPLKATAELSYVTNYDTSGTLDTDRQKTLYGETAITEEISLIMTDAGPVTHTWNFKTNGQLTSYAFADPGRALFENAVTERLCYYSIPAYPVTITVTAV